MGTKTAIVDRLHGAFVTAKYRHGFVHAADLSAHGFSRSGVSRLLDRGLIERVAPGWYRSTALPWSYDDRIRQADLLAGPSGWIAATSALHWFGVGPRPEHICILTPRRARPAAPNLRLIQTTDLRAVDTVEHRSVKVTTPTRSLIDAARMVSVDELHRLVSEAVERSLTSEAMVAARFVELARAGRPGVKTMRRVLSIRTDLVGPTATSFEQDLERIIRRGRFPTPVRQYRVACGDTSYRLDHAWPTHRCWSECDSMLAHSSPEQLASDLERQNRVIEATGWRPIRFTYRDVHDRPGYVEQRLASVLPRM